LVRFFQANLLIVRKLMIEKKGTNAGRTYIKTDDIVAEGH
jgi:hypothetical protein